MNDDLLLTHVSINPWKVHKDFVVQMIFICFFGGGDENAAILDQGMSVRGGFWA